MLRQICGNMFYCNIYFTGYQSGKGGNNEKIGSVEVANEQQWMESQVQPPVIQPSNETSQTQRNNFFKATEEQLKV